MLFYIYFIFYILFYTLCYFNFIFYIILYFIFYILYFILYILYFIYITFYILYSIFYYIWGEMAIQISEEHIWHYMLLKFRKGSNANLRCSHQVILTSLISVNQDLCHTIE